MTPPPASSPTAGPRSGRQVWDATRLRRPLVGRLADSAYLTVAGASAAVAVGLVAYLIYKTAAQTGPVWDTFGLWGFISGARWIVAPADGNPVFGAMPFIYGTLATSAIAMVIAVPLAVGIALATTVLLPRRLRGPVAGTIDLLAAVPSVVFGLWGVLVLVPAAKPALEWVSRHNPVVLAVIAVVLAGIAMAASGRAARAVTGLAAAMLALLAGLGVAGAVHMPLAILSGPVLSGSYLMAGLVLAIMVLPIVTAVTREVLATVPRDQQEAAFALGATRWEMIRDAMLPWARSGIVGASALGLGRAMGETIALALVLGNVPNIWGSLLGPGSTAAGVIASETAEAGELQLAALTALALVLFALTFVVNGIARMLVRRGGTGPGLLVRVMARRGTGETTGSTAGRAEPPEDRAMAPAQTGAPGSPAPTPVSRGRRMRTTLAEGLILATVVVGFVPLVVVLGQVLVGGVGQLSTSFFSEVQPVDPNAVEGYGIANALVGTLLLAGLATLLAAPLGILTTLFMNEMGARGGRARRVSDAIGFFVDVLLGMPSIVAGLTVYLGIVVVMQRFSLLAGGIALAIVMFPIVVRSADEVLRLVPSAQREAALALGAPRWRTAWSVVLPAAAPGILTGIVLAIARASGETAPLLFTSLGNQNMSTGLLEPIAALPQLIYGFTIQVRTDGSIAFSWGVTFVLVAFILLLNLTARLVTRLARTETR